MNRRSFLSALGMAPAVAAVVPAAAKAVSMSDASRVSIEKDDPGYRAYCEARGDGKTVKVFLDGMNQPYAITADVRSGYVKRTVITSNGNFAHDGRDILLEEVFGKVEIKIV